MRCNARPPPETSPPPGFPGSHADPDERIHDRVVTCLLLALFASGLIHRVCVTTCFIFSMVGLYYINKISSTLYQSVTPVPVPTKAVGKSRKRN
ncbi:hypothetical protein lerEdw1_002957 [Lerista edwardsae]|nr:hypothetical protein lerEdw1_002957 [Lerista edwardsae]